MSFPPFKEIICLNDLFDLKQNSFDSKKFTRKNETNHFFSQQFGINKLNNFFYLFQS